MMQLIRQDILRHFLSINFQMGTGKKSDDALILSTCAVVSLNILEMCVSVLQARREDQDPGEKGQRPDRRELHGAERGSPTAGLSICFSITQFLEYNLSNMQEEGVFFHQSHARICILW